MTLRFVERRNMNVLDFVLGIPYRVVGVFLVLICLILSIPLIVLPTILGLITKNMTIGEAYSVGKNMIGNATLIEIFETFKSGDWWTRMFGMAISKTLLGVCMILSGLYYKEAYEYIIHLDTNES